MNKTQKITLAIVVFSLWLSGFITHLRLEKSQSELNKIYTAMLEASRDELQPLTTPSHE